MKLYSQFYSPNDQSICYLNEESKVEFKGISHNKLIPNYTPALAAFDLYELNMERKLAITTRSIEYLYCGLPLIYSEGLELSKWIKHFDLGIVLKSPEDLLQMKSLKEVLESKRSNVLRFLKDSGFKQNALENLSSVLNLDKKKNILSPLIKIEQERRSFRKEVGELKSMGYGVSSNRDLKNKSQNEFYKDLWMKDMKDIYQRKLK